MKYVVAREGEPGLLYWLAEALKDEFGPLRLLTSRFVLGGLSLTGCFFITFWLLPRLMNSLPRDRGRAHAVESGAAAGKPTGAGIIFVTIFAAVELIVLPPAFKPLAVLGLTFAAMLAGWFDDKSDDAWGEYRKGAIDMVLGLAGATVLSGIGPSEIWLPLTNETFNVPAWLFIPVGTVLIWAAINSTNCTDGVDGLSGTLTAIAFTSLGGLLYFVLGHQEISRYLLLPHYPSGASWGIMAFSVVGTIMGYLWWNAHPSTLLMGDAGSRALGFLLGVFVILSGNPFTIFIVSGVLLLNGGTGLVKVALLRFFKISILSDVRFPLHDHVRHKRGWSNTQVLVRFSVVQVMITLILMVLLLKVR